ncbi:MAG TPA: hypothetical protein VJV79_28625 [Polyangiaceae bacterium]|nr:hypothetical protein [Polyangiaceae bacterium]
MPRDRRLPALLIRLLALSIACILAGQAFFSGVQVCQLSRAQAAACCDDHDGQSEADEGSARERSAAVSADEQVGDTNDCQCPAGCARGCCSPNRAIVGRVASTERVFGLGIELPMIEPAPARPSPEVPGILHVPKRAS